MSREARSRWSGRGRIAGSSPSRAWCTGSSTRSRTPSTRPSPRTASCRPRAPESRDAYGLLNTHGVLGYFEGLLTRPVRLRVDAPDGWLVGTALTRADDGTYRAPSYRRLVDSPLLIGELSAVTIWVGDIEVDIFVSSPVEWINAKEALYMTGEILEAAGDYLRFAPVERYAFLMVFLDGESMQRNRFRALGALRAHAQLRLHVPRFPAELRVAARHHRPRVHARALPRSTSGARSSRASTTPSRPRTSICGCTRA